MSTLHDHVPTHDSRHAMRLRRLEGHRPRHIACSGRARDVLDYIEREMVRRPLAFPFPVDGEFVAELRLPHDGLSRGEAERLKLYIDALVTDG